MNQSNIQVLSTKAPVGDSKQYTIIFSIQSSGFSASSARIMIDANIVDDLKESEKAQAILEELQKEFNEE